MEKNHYIIKYRKFKVDNTLYWDIHRGGWKFVVEALKSEFHADDGILLLNAVEDHIFHKKPIDQPWVGFVHQVPRNNLKIFPDLERLIKKDGWLKNLEHCKGIYTLSSYLKEFLDSQNLPVPVNRIFYPVDFQFEAFDYEAFEQKPKRIFLIGEYQRKFQSFFDLNAKGFQKVLLENDSYKRQQLVKNDSVQVVQRVSDQEYDSLLSENLVFLDLFDAPANTTVVECIARNTPILVNKLPGVVEYLGEAYPLYFDSIEEADAKLSDPDNIRAAYDYLVAMDKEKITLDHFIESMHGSPIYRSLDIPNPQKDKIFKRYDISVVVTSYNRVYNIHGLLDRFCKQNFEGTFELILWNNNLNHAKELDKIYEHFKDLLNIRIIQSTENYYCAMRLSMAHIMQSDYLIICDDDVQPNETYIQTFWDKFQQYGPEAILCARGHKFKPHELNEDAPDEVWRQHRKIKFYDESQEDLKIHFFHADNCLIPRTVLLKLNEFEWENLDFILVDDYWISYIVSHELRIPIWKIKFDDQFAFTPCADDENIALFHNPKVRKERVDFYVYHMKKGWPASVMEEPADTTAIKPANTHQKPLVTQKSRHFENYDISVVICTYTRHFNLKEIVRRFSEQETTLSFELVIWNNNFQLRHDLDILYEEYRDLLNIKVLHSSDNILCKPRLALASMLWGEKVIFCDDDVLPEKNYLNELNTQYGIYGPDALVCASGESFISNQLDPDKPYLVWKRDNIKWHTYDEPPCLVHYFHANSCILSRTLLKTAASFSYPKPEMAWIDDYWLSYLFSHVLGVNLQKIDTHSFLSFTNDSDANDVNIALSRNPNIKHHKVAFFQYHYNKGWQPTLKSEETH